MLKIQISGFLLIITLASSAQRYMDRAAKISFYSHAPIEDIRAENNEVASAIDIQTGEIVFQVTIKSFIFERSLMQEHFNETYLESDKYPKSVFKGKISNLKSVDFSKSGIYEVNVEGDLSIHGVTKKVSAKGSFEVTGEEINANSKFNISPADYDIKIPAIVRDNIAKSVEVSISVKYLPLSR